MKVETISIIGLGKVGASVALALKQKLSDLTVYGYDRDRDVMHAAKKQGIVDKTNLSMVNVAADGDIVITAVPLQEVKELLEAAGPHFKEHAVVLDMGVLKKPVQAWADEYMENGHYVGVRPVIAADYLYDGRRGLEAADADLFRNSVLCVMPSTHVEEEAVQTAMQIGAVLGAKPFYIDITEHDIYAQAAETLPGLLGAALFRTLSDTTGWNDVRRLAGQPFALGTAELGGESELAELTYQNPKAAVHWLREVGKYVEEMARWIENGDEEMLGALLTELNIQREEWLHERRENNWDEPSVPDVERPNLMQQMLGNLGKFGRRGKDQP